MSAMKKCAQLIIHQPDCMEQLKSINLNIHKISCYIRFRQIVDQTGTAARVIANYLKQLCKNEYTINESFFQEVTN